MAKSNFTLLFHFILSVKLKEASITEDFSLKLEKFLYQLVVSLKTIPLAITCLSDHSHIFVNFNPKYSADQFAKEIKDSTESWINEHSFTDVGFKWHDGYGVLTHSKAEPIVQYLYNQKEYHTKISFKEEMQLLFDVDEPGLQSEHDWF